MASEAQTTTPPPTTSTEGGLKLDMDSIHNIVEKIEQNEHVKKVLTLINEKTGLKKKHILAGCVAVLSLYLVVGYASGFIVALLGFLYPAYASVKAIESTEKDDDTQWLTYWVVYSAFTIAEFFSDIFLSWFPLYFLFKCAFLCWCMAPFSWNGSEFIYRRFIQPFVMKHEGDAEKLISQATGLAKDLYGKAEHQAKQVAMDHVLNSGEESKKDE
jgi:receptor expression-enhancing protein 5/6